MKLRVALASVLVGALAAPGVDAQRSSAAPSGRFREDGWRMLRWSMAPDDARSALSRAGITFTSSEPTGMFPLAPGTADGRAGFAEVSFASLQFTLDGREVRVEFENYQLGEIRVIRRGNRDRATAERDLLRLRGVYGPERSSSPIASVAHGMEYRWTDATTTLALDVLPSPDGSGWFATEVWTPTTQWPSWR
ncbi:MAG: hypothetical protein WCJ30_08655 [Deltaproteobacteria bacterium]